MSDTLGSLVDKLVVVNLKLWHVQDAVHQAAEKAEGLDADTVRKLRDLNMQRTGLMREIDVVLSEAVETGHAEVNPQIKIY